MTVFDFLAVVGALTGSLALIWDVIKWATQRANIEITLIPVDGEGSQAIDNVYDEPGVQVVANNIGGRPVTITHLSLIHYGGFCRELLRKPEWRGVIPNTAPLSLPYKLELGEYWVGYIRRKEELEERSAKGNLYVMVSFTGRKRAARHRLKF